jgi:hypothetical protein
MNEITSSEVDLLLHKLYIEQIPVVVYYEKAEVKVLQHGFLAGVSSEHGVTVSNIQSTEPLDNYVAVRIARNADGIGWKFWYNDSVDTRFGDTSLRFECPDGGRLILHFAV